MDLTPTLNYTWAHSIDTASDGEDFVPNAAMPDNSFNPARRIRRLKLRRAAARAVVLDVRSSRREQAGRLDLGGWALDGMFNFATGQPYTVHYIYDVDYNGSGEYFGRLDI